MPEKVFKEDLKTINEKLKAYVVVNMASTNPNVKEAQEMKELLRKVKNQVAKEYRMKNFLVLIGAIHPSRMIQL